MYLVFHALKKILMPRLTGSNFFGSGEYYLGMASGVHPLRLHAVCRAGAAECALLHGGGNQDSKRITPASYGGGQEGFWRRFFPHASQMQEAVFQKSFTGKYIKQYAGVMLINTESADADKTSLVPQKQPVIHIGN